MSRAKGYNVEAPSQVHYDKDGWEISPPISDRECIYRCL